MSNQGAYHHPKFVRGQIELCEEIQRVQSPRSIVSSSGTTRDQTRREPIPTPRLKLIMPGMISMGMQTGSSSSASFLAHGLPCGISEAANTVPDDEAKYEARMRIVEQARIHDVPLKQARTLERIKDSYRETMESLSTNQQQVAIQSLNDWDDDSTEPAPYHESTFPFLLHQLLEKAKHDEAVASIMSWLPIGRGFKIHNKERFMNEIAPNSFSQTRYKSFQRQLNLYGFQRTKCGPFNGKRHWPS